MRRTVMSLLMIMCGFITMSSIIESGKNDSDTIFTQLESMEKNVAYILAEGYFLDVPRNVDNLEKYVGKVNVNTATWKVSPVMLVMRVTPTMTRGKSPQAYFTPEKEFSAKVDIEDQDENDNVVKYRGALLLKVKGCLPNYQELASALPTMINLPHEAPITTIFANFQPDVTLRDKLEKDESEIWPIEISAIDDGWSESRKKENINLMLKIDSWR